MWLPRSEDALGAVVRYEGEIYEVIAIGDGRTVYLRRPGDGECPTCGQVPTVSVLENSPLFQNCVRPVSTVVERE